MSTRHNIKSTACRTDVVPCRVQTTSCQGGIVLGRHRVKTAPHKHGIVNKKTCRDSAMPSQHEFVLTTVLCQNDVVSKRCCGNTVSCQYDAMSKQHHAKNDGVTKRRRLKTMSHLKWHSVNMAPCHNDVVSMRRRAKRTSCQNDVAYSRRHVNTMPCECVVVSKRGHVNTVSCQAGVVSRRHLVKSMTCDHDTVSIRCRVRNDIV